MNTIGEKDTSTIGEKDMNTIGEKDTSTIGGKRNARKQEQLVSPLFRNTSKTSCDADNEGDEMIDEAGNLILTGKSLLIYICNFHVLSHLLLIYIRKLHWNLNTMFVCQVNYF